MKKPQASNRSRLIKTVPFLIIFLFGNIAYLFGQELTISGSTSVTQNFNYNYYVSPPGSVNFYFWGAYTGQVVSSGETYATVKWTNAGTQTLYYDAETPYDYYYGSLTVNVTGTGPSNPPNPTITSPGTCAGQATLTRSGAPPSGVTWYWQGKNSNGTSTNKGSGSTFITNEGSGNYYIRARNSSGQWSSGSGHKYVTITDPAPAPYTNNGTNACGTNNIVVRAITDPLDGTVLTGASHKWYTHPTNNTPTVTPTVVNAGTYYLETSYTVTSTTSFWVSTYLNGCESPRVKVDANHISNSIPTLYVDTDDSDKCDGSATFNLSASGGSTGSVYKWYTVATGGSAVYTGSNYQPTLTYSETGGTETYYVGGTLEDARGCSYTVTSRVPITVTVFPQTVPGTVSSSAPSQCGSGSMTFSISGHTGTVQSWRYRTKNGSANWSGWNTFESNPNVTSKPLTLNQWSSGVRTYEIQAIVKRGSCTTMYPSTTVTVNPKPSMPSTPTVSTNTCGNKTLTRGNPSGSTVWYWQGTNSNGFSTGNSSSTYTASASGTYNVYIRARSSAGCWSDPRSVQVTVNHNPSMPSTPTVSTNTCGNKTLTRGNPSGSTVWYWQGTNSNGFSTGNSSSTYTASASGTYNVYIKARSSAGCWSDPRSVQVTVNHNPSMPSTPTVSTNTCGNKTLTRGNPSGSTVWYWQGTNSNGFSTGNSSSTYTASASGTYNVYIRARSSAGCWSDPRSVQVTVNSIPSDYTLMGGGTRCSNEPGLTITLSGSQSSVNYQLKRDGNDLGSARPGSSTNNPISWTDLTAAGIYTVVATNSSGPCSSNMPGSPQIIVNSAPTVSAGPTQMVFLSTPAFAIPDGSPSGGTWSGTGVTGGDTFNPGVAGIGTHTITYSYTNGSNCSDSDTRNITVDLSPVIQLSGPSTIQAGETVTLSVPTGYSSYQWIRNSQNITGANNNTYVVSQKGDYQAQITTSSGTSYTTTSLRIEKNFGSQDQNFIKTVTFKKAGLDSNDIPEDNDDISMKIDYFDGLGRSMQQVVWSASPNESDIIQPVLYDSYGRTPTDFLTYANGNTASYNSNAADLDGITHQNSDQYDFYQTATKVAHDTKPYAVKIFEASPLNRVLKQGAPGTVWQPDPDPTVTTDHVVRFDYASNAVGEVYLWSISSGQPVSTTDYGAGQLQKVTTGDEQGNKVVEYTDKLGRTVLKKVETGESTPDEWALTYYVYDDFNNLRFVLPPKIFEGGSSLESGELDALAFQYKYDGRRRMIEKKVPGAGWVYMVYDNRDRLVMTQDANQRAGGKKEWTFIKYDHLNRPVLTGIYVHDIVLDQDQMQGVVNQFYVDAETNADEWYEERGSVVHGYTNNSFPKVSNYMDYLTVTYYDDYDFITDQAWLWGTDYDYSNPAISHFFNDVSYSSEQSENTSVKGQVTATKVKVIDGSWSYAVTYYDERYRPIQVVSTNHLGGMDITSNLYDFTGKVLKTKTVHNDGTQSTAITRTYDYDHADRLLTVKHRVNSGTEVTLISNEYNELGELVDKKLHSTNGVDFTQSLDYRYNIRGWMTGLNMDGLNQGDLVEINDPKPDFFGMELIYEKFINVPTN